MTPQSGIDMGHHFRRWWLVFWHRQANNWTNIDSSLKMFCGIHQRVVSQTGCTHEFNHSRSSEIKHSLHWNHNGRDGVSNHQPHDFLLNRLFRCRSKKTSKLRVTGLCVGNSPWSGEFPAQMVSNAEKVSIWWRHHVRLLPYFSGTIEVESPENNYLCKGWYRPAIKHIMLIKNLVRLQTQAIRQAMADNKETPFALLAPLSPTLVGGFLSQRAGNALLIISLLLAWRSCWRNCKLAGDLRRHDTHHSGY